MLNRRQYCFCFGRIHHLNRMMRFTTKTIVELSVLIYGSGVVTRVTCTYHSCQSLERHCHSVQIPCTWVMPFQARVHEGCWATVASQLASYIKAICMYYGTSHRKW